MRIKKCTLVPDTSDVFLRSRGGAVSLNAPLPARVAGPKYTSFCPIQALRVSRLSCACSKRLWDGVKVGVDGDCKTKLPDLNADSKGNA